MAVILLDKMNVRPTHNVRKVRSVSSQMVMEEIDVLQSATLSNVDLEQFA